MSSEETQIIQGTKEKRDENKKRNTGDLFRVLFSGKLEKILFPSAKIGCNSERETIVNGIAESLNN